MPVDTKHPDYNRWIDRWRKCRDVAEGEEAVKAKTSEYLPPLSGQSADQTGDGARAYQMFLRYAWFYGATGRTIEGLVGMLFRKPPMIKVPKGMEEFMENVDGEGTTFQSYLEKVAEEVLTTGRDGTLVDYPQDAGKGLTRDQAKSLGRRPFLATYSAESITNWNKHRKGAELRAGQVRLFERAVTGEVDEFDQELQEQYRVAELDPAGKYRNRVFRRPAQTLALGEESKSDPGPEENGMPSGSYVEDGAPVYPRMNGNALEEVPFVFFGPKGNGPDVEKPPLMDLVNANLAWYRNCAVLEHGLIWAGNPTPWVTGHRAKPGTVMPIGSSEFISLEEENAKLGYLEFTGAALESVFTAMASKEQIMAKLGARMLMPEKSAAETAEKAEIDRYGETSALGRLAVALSMGAKKVLTIVRDWYGLSGDIEVEVNRSFFPQGTTPQMIEAMVTAWQKKVIAYVDLHRFLQNIDAIAQDRKPEDIQKDLAQELEDGLGAPDPATQAIIEKALAEQGDPNADPSTDPDPTEDPPKKG